MKGLLRNCVGEETLSSGCPGLPSLSLAQIQSQNVQEPGLKPTLEVQSCLYETEKERKEGVLVQRRSGPH